jgi:hypothetical protein
MYDQAHLTKAVSPTALETVHDILRASGIDSVVRAGDPAADEASLITIPAPLGKGQEQAVSCEARRDIALEIVAAAPPSRKTTILGTAVPLAREGLNVRVFDDRIREEALKWSRSHGVLLAHVIAHEIGHVLLRSGGHSPSGLMSSSWGEREYGWIMRGLMLFSSAESQRMRMTLSGSGCPADVPPARFRSDLRHTK